MPTTPTLGSQLAQRLSRALPTLLSYAIIFALINVVIWRWRTLASWSYILAFTLFRLGTIFVPVIVLIILHETIRFLWRKPKGEWREMVRTASRTIAHYFAELPITLAQSACAGIGGMVIGAAISPFSASDPGTCCLYGALCLGGFGFIANSWKVLERARDLDLS